MRATLIGDASQPIAACSRFAALRVRVHERRGARRVLRLAIGGDRARNRGVEIRQRRFGVAGDGQRRLPRPLLILIVARALIVERVDRDDLAIGFDAHARHALGQIGHVRDDAEDVADFEREQHVGLPDQLAVKRRV